MNRRESMGMKAGRLTAVLLIPLVTAGCFEHSLPMKQLVTIDLDKKLVTVTLEDLRPVSADKVQDGLAEIDSMIADLRRNKGILMTDTVDNIAVTQTGRFEIDKDGRLSFVYQYQLAQDSSAAAQGESYFSKWRVSNRDLIDILPIAMVSNGEVIVNARPFIYSSANREVPDSLTALSPQCSIVKTGRNSLIVFPDSIRHISYGFDFKWSPHAKAVYDKKKLRERIRN